MGRVNKFILSLLTIVFLISDLIPYVITDSDLSRDEVSARELLEKLEDEVGPACHKRALKEWLFASNLTDFNRIAAAESSLQYSKFWREIWNETRKFNWKGFHDQNIKRQFMLLSTLGISILPDPDLKKYNSLKQSMESTYAKARICDFHNKTKCDLALEPEITEIFKSSRDPEELKHAWVQWRIATGRKVKENYTEMVKLIRMSSELNGFPDASEYELRAYDSPTFRQDIEDLWQQLKPFYEQLHAYVRFKLRKFYGVQHVPLHGTIPAHLLGNNWAQTWESIEDLVIPFKAESVYDVSKKMQDQNMTAYRMAKISEDFFISLNFSQLGPEFWEGSILEKPKDRDIICHASAWDLCNRRDFRIKQCTTITETDLLTLHHEMGHTYYQMSYKDLPKVYRDGANPGFHEAIGDLIALSVQTPEHMKQIGLIEDFNYDDQVEINFLLRTALTKIAFLPFGYILDLWKWNLYQNETMKDLNCEWWKLRMTYQGISPPVTRIEELDFDPGAKFHVVSNVPYIRYLVSMVLQFQLHESLCKTAGVTKPLHRCDIYNSKAAGNKLRKMLELGKSKPWPDALEQAAGVRKMDARPIIQYFKPLMDWLEIENRKNNEKPGWTIHNKPVCITRNSRNQSIRMNSNFLMLIIIVVIQQ